MKPGWRTSEFWLACHWSAMAGAAVASLLHFLPGQWQSALIASPAVCLLVWLAGAQGNNYGENRFQLKAQRRATACQGGHGEQDSDPGKTFVFGPQLVGAPQTGEEEDERAE